MKHKVGQITQNQSESFYQASTQNISNNVTSSPIHESTMENIHEVIKIRYMGQRFFVFTQTDLNFTYIITIFIMKY